MKKLEAKILNFRYSLRINLTCFKFDPPNAQKMMSLTEDNQG